MHTGKRLKTGIYDDNIFSGGGGRHLKMMEICEKDTARSSKKLSPVKSGTIGISK